MKLPMAVPYDSRDGTNQKDSRPVNVLKDASAVNESVIKRPALVKVTGPAAPANGNGLVDFDGTLISVYGAQLAHAKPSYGFEETKNTNPVPIELSGGCYPAVSGKNCMLVRTLPSYESNRDFYLSKDFGETWAGVGNPYGLIDPDLYERFAAYGWLNSFAAFIDGSWFVAFIAEDKSVADAYFLIVSRHDDSGWSIVRVFPTKIYDTFFQQYSYCLSACENRLAVAIKTKISGTTNVHVSFSLDLGGTWTDSPPVECSEYDMLTTFVETSGFVMIPFWRYSSQVDQFIALTSTDWAAWFHESDGLTMSPGIVSGSYARGGFSYTMILDDFDQTESIVVVESVSPLTVSEIPFNEFDPVCYPLRFMMESSGAMSVLLFDYDSKKSYLCYSLNLGKTWETTEVPLDLRLYYYNEGQIGSSSESEEFLFLTSGWSSTTNEESRAFKFSPAKVRFVELTTLMDRPFDFAQSAL